LSCSLKYEEKADGIKLKKLILSDSEWELLDELCNILAPFEKATRDFSGNTYVTLSQIVPIITNLMDSLSSSSDNLEEYEEDFDDKTIASDSDESLISFQQTEVNYNNIAEVLKNVKKNIYIGLKHYWAVPNEFGIMAALLDPRYKDLNFISDEKKQAIHSTLQAEYDKLKWEIHQQSVPPSPITDTSTTSTDTSVNSTPSTRSLREHKARREQKTKEVLRMTENTNLSTLADEIDTYFLMPIVRENKNPLDWWRTKCEIFPILSIIAKKYLGIPATSVASERLFSDAGNHITAKRNSLSPDLLGKMLFLKRNMITMDHINVFPSDLTLNAEKSDFIDEHEFGNE
jgi:hypothetical protein